MPTVVRVPVTESTALSVRLPLFTALASSRKFNLPGRPSVRRSKQTLCIAIVSTVWLEMSRGGSREGKGGRESENCFDQDVRGVSEMKRACLFGTRELRVPFDQENRTTAWMDGCE